jgi:hypothetical protein
MRLSYAKLKEVTSFNNTSFFIDNDDNGSVDGDDNAFIKGTSRMRV